MNIIITNNPLVEAKFRGRFKIEFRELKSDVLSCARDLVHAGHSLLTHPLSGSVKPNETPYKSVLVSGDRGILDEQSLRIIEDCIQVSRGFVSRAFPEENLPDLQEIDLSLTSSAPVG